MGMQTSIACQQIRAELVETINQIIDANGWTQYKAADLCGQTQPRISDLKHRRSGRFSIDALVNIFAALRLHSQAPKGNTMEHTEAEGQRLAAEFMANLADRPVKGRYPVATEHSTTEKGGQIIATSGISTPEGRVALVGDIVRYPDGRQTRIITGSGTESIDLGRPIALVGSELENGDRINGPMHNGLTLTEYADETIPGLFQPGYIVSAH